MIHSVFFFRFSCGDLVLFEFAQEQHWCIFFLPQKQCCGSALLSRTALLPGVTTSPPTPECCHAFPGEPSNNVIGNDHVHTVLARLRGGQMIGSACVVRPLSKEAA